jgi:hypothetical protein
MTTPTFKSPRTDYLIKMWKDELIKTLTQESFFRKLSPDTRPRWKKILAQMRYRTYWYTIGWFKAWLHRDCGGDW